VLGRSEKSIKSPKEDKFCLRLMNNPVAQVGKCRDSSAVIVAGKLYITRFPTNVQLHFQEYLYRTKFYKNS